MLSRLFKSFEELFFNCIIALSFVLLIRTICVNVYHFDILCFGPFPTCVLLYMMIFFFFSCFWCHIISRLVAKAIDATFSRGDAIAIDMQMTANAVIIYLAIVLAGCAVVSIADSFAPKEIATRLRVSKAKGIFTQVMFQLKSKLPLIEMEPFNIWNVSVLSYLSICANNTI